MPFLDAADGTTLYYADWGSGRPVVFIHGWAMNSNMWEYQLPWLIDQSVRCVVYDQRGCGRSDHPARGYDFDTLAADLYVVLRRVDAHHATLVGFSLGGGVIARYLARYGSDRVARTVMIGTNTPYLWKCDDNPEGLDRSRVYEGFMHGLQTDRPKLLAECAPAFFGEGAVSKQMAEWVVGLCHGSNPVGMLELYRAVNHTDFRPDMAAFTMPTLIIHGDADPFQPIEATGRRTARAIRSSRLIEYEGASHGLFVTHRERLNADLLVGSRDL